jgi:hypothetical protein
MEAARAASLASVAATGAGTADLGLAAADMGVGAAALGLAAADTGVASMTKPCETRPGTPRSGASRAAVKPSCTRIRHQLIEGAAGVSFSISMSSVAVGLQSSEVLMPAIVIVESQDGRSSY